MKQDSIARWKHLAWTTVLGSVLCASALAAELIDDGGFELGKPNPHWSATTLPGGRAGSTDIFQGSYPHNGSLWYAYLGDTATTTFNALGSVHQFIAIPSDAATVTLTFYLNVVTTETTSCDCDKLDVNLRTSSDTLIRKLVTYTEADKGSNINGAYGSQRTIDLTPYIGSYKGQTILLQFYVDTDGSKNTIFRVDDVSVMATSVSTPDLTPYQPAQWNDKIPIGTSQLAANATHNYTGPYYSSQFLYFNWASNNQGDETASGYSVHVEVTGSGGGSWDWSDLSTPAGIYTRLNSDLAVGPLLEGNHTFKVWVDYHDDVDEGANEGNNYYERTITVQPPPNTTPDLTLHQAPHWNDTLPISTSQLPWDATHNYAGPYYSNQKLYVNWMSHNQGGAGASGYSVHVEVTGSGGGSWDWSDLSTPAGIYTRLNNDLAVGPLLEGSHTFKVWVDYHDDVDEGANEGNNYYERTITVQSLPGATPDLTLHQPPQWSDTIPIGIIQLPWFETHDYTGPYYSSQTLYFNWMSHNQGDAGATGYSVHVEVTGGGGGSWDWSGLSTPVTWFTRAANDQAFGPLSEGTHTIKVWVDYNDNVNELLNEGNNYFERTITVTAPSPAPVARFSGDLQPVTGKSVTYDGGISTGTSLGYEWTLSDGRTSSARKPVFAFNSPGQYSISLTVTDSIGRTSTASAILHVQASNNGSSPAQPVGADPVVLSAGNYVQQHVDLRMPGKGFPFEFKRFYNSKFGDQTGLPLGFGWTHAYNERINDLGASALVIRGDGSTWTFVLSGEAYDSEPGVFDTLTHNGDGTWSLTDKAQTVKQFDPTGRLVSITDKNGNALTLLYTDGALRQIQDTAGRTVLLNTNAFGCISDITDPIGRTVVFQYDSNTNLVGVIDANGQTSTNQYDGIHQLTDAFDPKGNCYVHNEYDPESFVVRRQRDVLNNWTFFDYNFTNRITYQTNVLGKLSVYSFDTNLFVINVVDEALHQQSFAYDTNRNRILVNDKNGNPTSYGYDTNGNVTNKTDTLNNPTGIEYDAANNPTKRLDALNQSTGFAYDGSGNLTQTTNDLGQVTQVEYDASGLPHILTDANGRKTTNTFDIRGNLVAVQDAAGNTTTFGYDAAGRRVAHTNANNQVTTYVYDNKDNLVRMVDPLNGTNTYVYDANNNRIVTVDARGASTTNTFDLKDRLIAVRDAMGGITSYEYDALDRKTKMTDARGGVTTFGYDDVGNLVATTNALTQVTRYTYDANGNRTSVTNPQGQTSTNIFDALNRLVMTIDPEGHTNRTVYDALGQRVQTIDALNRTNQLNYDSVGRLTQVKDANGGTTAFAYDSVGNRLVTTDPNNHSTTNTFDALNRLAQNREPGGGVYQFAYDGAGNRTNQVDPKGQIIGYTYDGNNRRTVIIYPTGTPVTFGYDANNNRTSMTDSLGTTIYQYDALNRLVSVTDPFGKTVSYGYDANGNRVSLTYPDGKTVTYGYDALNRMVWVTDWLGGVTTYAYDAAGNLIHTGNPNATAVDYGYDTASRLVALTNSGPAAAIIASYAYTLDAVGNHTQVDQVEPLQTVPVVGSFNYTYDSDNRMLTFEGQAEAFDANGNLVSNSSTNLLAYDFENRLTQTVIAGKTNTYQYDGAGNRLSADRDQVVTRYVLDRGAPLTQVLAETDADGTITAYYVYGLGLISKIDPAGNAQYYHFDSRGSTTALTDASGQVTETYAYDPFGVPRNASASANRFRYLGRHGVVDEFNGFGYIRARYYSARRGRFITKDPATGNDGDAQSLNRYIYALNNPIRLIDVSGLTPRDAVHIQRDFATSDDSHFHNYLISPETNGRDMRTAGSTPQLLQENDLLKQSRLAKMAPTGGSIIRAPTTEELIYRRELELMGIDPGTPFARRQWLDYLVENQFASWIIYDQVRKEILGSDYKGLTTSDKWAAGIAGGMWAVNLLDFTGNKPPVNTRVHHPVEMVR